MSREFFYKQLDLSVGDVVYYVIGEGAVFSIRKTRVMDIQTRYNGLGIHGIKMEYTVYITEDGHILSRSFRNKKDELDSSQVFLTKVDAVQYVIDRLQREINSERHVILNAQARLSEAERALKVYQKYQ
jgi:hypothetical protein